MKSAQVLTTAQLVVACRRHAQTRKNPTPGQRHFRASCRQISQVPILATASSLALLRAVHVLPRWRVLHMLNAIPGSVRHFC